MTKKIHLALFNTHTLKKEGYRGVAAGSLNLLCQYNEDIWQIVTYLALAPLNSENRHNRVHKISKTFHPYRIVKEYSEMCNRSIHFVYDAVNCEHRLVNNIFQRNDLEIVESYQIDPEWYVFLNKEALRNTKLFMTPSIFFENIFKTKKYDCHTSFFIGQYLGRGDAFKVTRRVLTATDAVSKSDYCGSDCVNQMLLKDSKEFAEVLNLFAEEYV